MNKRIALGLAALSLVGVTAGIALANDNPASGADAPMPAAGFDDLDETIVTEYPAPGFEDQDETIVVDGAGMVVPGYEGEVVDFIVE